jgi:hypothetical protein
MKTLPTAPQVPQMRHQASRRALLMGFAAAATPMAPALASALSGPAPPVAGPIFAVIERHRAALEQYDAAREHFQAMDALYPREEEPDEFWSKWSVEERLAWRDAEMARREGGPRDIAYERWNDQHAEVSESTEALVATLPITIAGTALALEYWADFSALISDNSFFDFLELDCGSRAMANIASTLRNIIERGQA